MTILTRRAFGISALALTAMAGAARAEKASVIKVGYQKTNLPVIAKQLGVIEKALAPLNVSVEWVEFAAGPPLVEALNVGAISVGWTGDSPPIFGQAAGANIVYTAALPPNGKGEGVFTKESTGIKTIAELKGKKVAVAKGTSAHNSLIAALEGNGLQFSDIEVVYLGPADAAAAFASDQVVAWAVWDPFFAIAETKYKLTVLSRTSDFINVNTYFLANKDFATDNPDLVKATIAALGEAAVWADANRDKVAEAVAEVTKVPLDANTLAVSRAVFGIFPITPEIIAGQQATADRFFKLGLLPKPVVIADAVWKS